MITVSENAAVKIKQLMNESNQDSSYFIRVNVVGGGCSGLSYQMDFDNVPLEDEESFEDKGIKLRIGKKSLLYLIGTELDYSGGLNGKGFEWNNPQATRVCSCGDSFSI